MRPEKNSPARGRMRLPLAAEAFDVVFANTSSGFNITLVHAAGRIARARPVDGERSKTEREEN